MILFWIINIFARVLVIKTQMIDHILKPSKMLSLEYFFYYKKFLNKALHVISLEIYEQYL